MYMFQYTDMKERERESDPFFESGTKEDIQIWTIKDSKPFSPVRFGVLYDEEVCLVLETRISIYGVATHQLHIWVGSEAKDEDVTHATRHAATLDQKLRHRVTVHLERQNQECEQFLEYFRPCIQYSPGPRPEEYSSSVPLLRGNKLFAVFSRGKYAEVKQVKCDISSVNQLDPLVLVTEKLEVYALPRGWRKGLVANIGSSLRFRAWAERFQHNDDLDYSLDVVQLDEYAFPADWDIFYKALGCEDQDTIPAIPKGEKREEQTSQPTYTLFEILRNRKGRTYYKDIRFPVRREDLDSQSLYILSNGQYDVNLWVGKNNQDRNKNKLYGVAKLKEFMAHFGLPSCAHMTIITEGLEPICFKELFKNWMSD